MISKNKLNMAPLPTRPTQDQMTAELLASGQPIQPMQPQQPSPVDNILSGLGQGAKGLLQGFGDFINSQKDTPEGRLLLNNMLAGVTVALGADPMLGANIVKQGQEQFKLGLAKQEKQQELLLSTAKRQADIDADVEKFKRKEEIKLKMSPYGENYRRADISTQQNIINDPSAIEKGIVIRDESNPSNVFVTTKGDDYTKYVDQKRKETSEYEKQKKQTELLSKKIDNMLYDEGVYKVLGVSKIGPFNIKRTSLAKVFGLSEEQMNDLANIDSIKSDKFARLFADLRDPRTGATGFGSLSEAELKVVSDMLVNLETSQSEEQFKNNLQILKDYMEERTVTKGQELSQNYAGIEVYTPNTSNITNRFKDVGTPNTPSLIDGYKLLGVE